MMESPITAYLTENEAPLIAFCQRLLQTPSVNGVHSEAQVAQLIAEQAELLGLDVQLVASAPDRPNILVSTAAHGDGGLLLIGHLDTVPTGDESAWDFPPFSGELHDGKLYGRGAIDTKGGIAAAIFALAALKHTDNALSNSRAQFIGVPDEESGATGTLGIKFLHARGLLHGLSAIYAYSGNEIILGHRGLIRYLLTCEGEAAHTGFPSWQDGTAGANAVTGMAHLLTSLERIVTPHSPVPRFERFRTMLTPGTTISGGVAAGVVPERCQATMDVRLTPEFDIEQVSALIKQTITDINKEHPKLRFTFYVTHHLPAAISPEDAPIFSVLETVVSQVRGRQPIRTVAGPANEGYLLIERGIPTVCGFGVIGANAHAANEYVEVASLRDTAQIFALTAMGLDSMLKNPNV
ncbi:MAG: ArgE/DapE family deacylase [Anaerolineae bacterium]